MNINRFKIYVANKTITYHDQQYEHIVKLKHKFISIIDDQTLGSIDSYLKHFISNKVTDIIYFVIPVTLD